MQIKLNNGIIVEINPDTKLYSDSIWTQRGVKSVLKYCVCRYDRKFNISLVHALIFQAYHAIIIDNGDGVIREFHCTREERQKRIRHFRYLRQKTKN